MENTARVVGPGDWVGKHPSDPIENLTFFKLPSVAKSLASVLSHTDHRYLNGLAVESIVEKEDSFLYVSVCRPHDCWVDSAVVIFDLRTNQSSVLFAPPGKPFRCVSNEFSVAGDFPESIREYFLETQFIPNTASDRELPKHPELNTVACHATSKRRAGRAPNSG